MKTLLFKISGCLILFLPLLAYSAGSEFSPKAIFIQVFNFSIFAFAFFFLVRKPLQTLFHKRQKDFFAFEEQALTLEKEKQKENQLWDSKLSDLESKEKSIQEKAQAEGERFKAQKKKELKELSERLKKTAEFLLNLEREKLKRKSLSHWRKQLVKSAKADLNQLALTEDFQNQEQRGFLELLKQKKLTENRGI